MSSAPQTIALPAPSEASGGLTTHRDLQRAALRDLVALSAECAASEATIEQDHKLAVQAEVRRHQKAIAELGEKFNNSREQGRAKHADQIVEIERKFNSSLADLKSGETRTRREGGDKGEIMRFIWRELMGWVLVGAGLYTLFDC